MLSNRTFGIEIEAFGITKQAAETALRSAGIDARIEGYNHEARGTGRSSRTPAFPMASRWSARCSRANRASA